MSALENVHKSTLYLNRYSLAYSHNILFATGPSPAPYAETSPIAENEDIGLDYVRGFSIDHLLVLNTAPSDEGIAAMLGDAADFSGLDSEY